MTHRDEKIDEDEYDKLLDQVLDLNEAESLLLLTEVEFRTPDIAARLKADLSRINASASFLQTTQLERMQSARIKLTPGQVFGSWRLLQVVGFGGMGQVWEVERADESYQQRAALKLLKTESIANEALFLRERQVLAGLNHPGILRLIDGGNFAGQHYFVTEFIEGENLDYWLKRANPNIFKRLNLFCQICAAVAYAHAHLVVHRDIKPSNILIDKAGDPHLIDFGIAKLLAPEPKDHDAGVSKTLLETQTRFFSPEFGSPEQLTGAAITVRTDVYSLGGLLFWLLTERAPTDCEGLSTSQIIEKIRFEEIDFPSKIGWAKNLNASAWKIDLDIIVTRAMQKPPEARYASVESLNADVENLLSSRPIVARAPTKLYVLSRYLKRHAGMVAASAAVLLALMVGLLATAWQAKRAVQERDLAQQERANAVKQVARAESALSTLGAVFRDSDAETRGNANEWLDRALTYVTQPGRADRAARAQLLASLAEIESNREQLARAAERYTDLLENYPDVLDPHVSARAHCDYASVLSIMGELEKAVQHLSIGTRTAEQLTGSNRDALVYCLSAHGFLVRDNATRQQAFEAIERALVEVEKLIAVDASARWQKVLVLRTFGVLLGETGNPNEARKKLGQAAALNTLIGNGDSPIAAHIMASLAGVSMQSENILEAQKVSEQARDLLQRHAKKSFPLANHLVNEAGLHNSLWQSEQALIVAQQALETLNAVVGKSSVYHGLAHLEMGRAHFREQRFDQALRALATSRTIMIEAAGPDSDFVLRPERARARVLLERGESIGAAKLIEPMIDRLKQKTPGAALADALSIRAAIALAERRYIEAEIAVNESIALFQQIGNPTGFRIALVELTRAEIMQQAGRQNDATVIAKQIAPVLEGSLGIDHPRAKLARAMVLGK